METLRPFPSPPIQKIKAAFQGMNFPVSTRELLEYASKSKFVGKGLAELIKDLPERVFHDAIEISEALAGIKKNMREPALEEPVYSYKSPHVFARVFVDLDFPKEKADLKQYVEKNWWLVDDPFFVMDLLEDLPERQYSGMSDLEKEAAKCF